MGVRGVKMTYDSFFKYIFDAEVHPERLGDFLSAVLGRSLKVKRALRNEHRKISEKGSLILTDIIVEFESGELVQHCIKLRVKCTCLLRQHCVVVSQRCHRIASFLRLALTQNSGTFYFKFNAMLY